MAAQKPRPWPSERLPNQREKCGVNGFTTVSLEVDAQIHAQMGSHFDEHTKLQLPWHCTKLSIEWIDALDPHTVSLAVYCKGLHSTLLLSFCYTVVCTIVFVVYTNFAQHWISQTSFLFRFGWNTTILIRFESLRIGLHTCYPRTFFSRFRAFAISASHGLSSLTCGMAWRAVLVTPVLDQCPVCGSWVHRDPSASATDVFSPFSRKNSLP